MGKAPIRKWSCRALRYILPRVFTHEHIEQSLYLSRGYSWLATLSAPGRRRRLLLLLLLLLWMVT
jgi:hypothetical protein